MLFRSNEEKGKGSEQVVMGEQVVDAQLEGVPKSKPRVQGFGDHYHKIRTREDGSLFELLMSKVCLFSFDQVYSHY